jgi:hypothetical protein
VKGATRPISAPTHHSLVTRPCIPSAYATQNRDRDLHQGIPNDIETKIKAEVTLEETRNTKTVC